MIINTDINVLGSLSDFNLITYFAFEHKNSKDKFDNITSFTTIKTVKSVNRFEKAILNNYLKFKNPMVEALTRSILKNEKISNNSRLLLFWNVSFNNQLFYYLNQNIYFSAFYSGRVSIKNDEVVACIKELKQSDDYLKKWSETTITITASKYLTLLKKFGLMEGSVNKNIVHPYLSDSMLIIFAYWLSAISDRPNLLNSGWLHYVLSEKQSFLDRLLQKRFSKYFNVVYTGDKLNIEPLIPYESIYEYIYKS